MKRIAAALLLALAAPHASATIEAPEKWRKESFTFPLRFAPSIPYLGTEFLRFPPEWDQFETEGGFSYVFVWEVKAQPVTAEDVEEYLEIYFNGLMRNVANARRVTAPEVKAVVAGHPMTRVDNWEQAFGAQVRTWNTFSKGEPILLYAEVTQRHCGPDRMQLFFALSPSRRDRPIWNSLRDVRKATTCEAPRS